MRFMLIKRKGVNSMIVFPDDMNLKEIMSETKKEELVRHGSFCFFKKTARNENGQPVLNTSAVNVKVISEGSKEEKKKDEKLLMDILTEDL